MNKTININLGGFFFHIDEVAYKVLKRYLDSIGKSLSDDPQGKNEIIADIEARISELLSEKIADERQVINENDINDIIKIMGQPEDYADTDETYNTEYSYNQRNSYSNSKKLYRDPDDKFLGGVASGMGHYFDIDAIWIRLIFIFITIFSGGTGILLYVILWIVLPEAKTTAEKLQMEGEAVNIDSIEKKIRTEYENISEKIKNKDYKNVKTGFQNFLDALGKVILSIFTFLGKFIGIILILLSSLTIIGLLITAFSFGSFDIIGVNYDIIDFPPFFYESMLPKWVLLTIVFIAIGIPFVVLFILGLRIVSSETKQFGKATSLSLLGIWLVAILFLIFRAIEFNSSNAIEGSKISTKNYEYIKNDTLLIKVINNDDLYFKKKMRRSSHHETVFQDGKKVLYCNDIRIDVVQSENKELSVKIRKESEGQDRYRAKESADKIEYNYRVNDNSIILDGYFLSPTDNKMKSENISVTISVPENLMVYFANSTKSFLDDVDNTQRIYDGDMVNKHFLMTHIGLECTDCDEEIFNN